VSIPDVTLERPKILDIEAKMPWGEQLTEIGNNVLKCLLENRDSNAWFVAKSLKENYSTILKVFKEQMKHGVQFIEVGKRPHQKNKKQETVTYSLTMRGYRAVINPFYVEYSGNEKERIKALNRLFSKVREDYSSYLPELFRTLPAEYSVCFYPFFSDITYPFRKLLEAKSKEPEKIEFLVDNSYFSCQVPLTKNEMKQIQEFVEGEIEETARFHREALKEIGKKRALLNKLKAQ
jgi:RNA processing factor Prp31